MQIVIRSISKLAISMLTCLLLAASLPAIAADAEFSSVSTEVLKDMLDAKQEFTLVDARTKEEYSEAHIGKALNITEKDFEKVAASLPSDRGALLVFYCNGIKCGKSKKVAAKAKAAGYTNVRIYGEGFPVWEEKGMPIIAGADYAKKISTTRITPAALEKVLREKKDAYVLVDVRDEFEFAEGHIAGAINIPAETFASKSAVLPKEKAIVVYCNSGGRSYMAYRKLMKLAYPTIFQTTFAEWKDAGLPIVKSQL
jgi:rhodanese-related sulfurtransferase